MLRFLILLFYYNRERLVCNALQSICETTYNNYEIACIDDGSRVHLKDIVEQKFPQLLGKCKFYRCNDTKEEKIARGGSIFGYFANLAIKESDSDIVLMLNDDDALQKDYLDNLNKFYSENSDIKYAYSHGILFNPLTETFENVKNKTQGDFLCHTTPIYPYHRLDSSQVSWRKQCNIEGNCWFPYPQTKNLDASIYQQFYDNYGNCVWTGYIGQFKGRHGKQLGHTSSYDDPE